MSATVTYKGSTLTTVHNTTKTLETAGTWLEDDIEIADSSLDISDSTVDAEHLASGYIAYNSSGNKITGTMTGGATVIRDEQDSHGGTIRHITTDVVVEGTKQITTNGTHDVGDYASAEVDVEPNLQSKTVNSSTSAQTVTPDSGYDGLSAVTVNAIATGTAGTPTATKGTVSNHSVSVTPSVTNTTGYISGGTKTGTAVSVSASELVSGTKSITENGTGIDVTNYSSVDVDVSGGGGGVATATLTYSALSSMQFNLYAPILVEMDAEMSGVSEYLYAGTTPQTVDILLYNGASYVHIDNTVTSMSGDIEEDEDGYYFITGDCTIIIS